VIVGAALQALPQRLVLAVVASAIELGAGAWAGAHLVGQRYRAQIAAGEAERAQAAAAAASAAQSETLRRVGAQQEIARDAQHATAAARADAARADAAAAALRVQLGAYLAAGPGRADPAAAAGSAPAGAADPVLADLFGRVVSAAGQLAAGLDAATAAGRACERAYGALTP
jgi:hypothetical protein